MKNQVLSIKKMQHLKELGVNLGKYSMEWCIFHETDYDAESGKIVRINDEVLEILEIKGKYKIGYDLNESSLFECAKIIPAFTLQDMLEMMPENLYYCCGDSTEISLEPMKYSSKCELGLIKVYSGYMVEYADFDGDSHLTNKTGKTALEAAYKMLCWLAENKLLGKEK